MYPLVTASALVLTVIAFATGCSSAPSATSESSADDTAPAASLTQVVDTSAGKILADAQGLSLYTFDPDTATASNCNGGCARAWPPLLAPVDPDAGLLAAPFGEITRSDGKQQVTFETHPLYRYAGDAHQGDVKGEGLGGVWHLARPAATP